MSNTGSAGGKAVYDKYGREHMSKIGKSGAKRWKELYEWKVVPVTRYALVRKSDNTILHILGERPY